MLTVEQVRGTANGVRMAVNQAETFLEMSSLEFPDVADSSFKLMQMLIDKHKGMILPVEKVIREHGFDRPVPIGNLPSRSTVFRLAWEWVIDIHRKVRVLARMTDHVPVGWIQEHFDDVAERMLEFDQRDADDLVAWLEKELDRVLAALVASGGTDPTKNTTSKKKPRKKRAMTVEAADCARRFKNRKKRDPSVKLKIVVQDYVEDAAESKPDKRPPSAESIIRILNDNPEQWKTT